MERPHVVIVGGGFGGLNAAHALRDDEVRVTLVDRRNHHVFQPLLYQVATAALNPSDIAAPLRKILRHQENLRVTMAEATGVDLQRKKLLLDDGEMGFDFLVLATGASHSYFGNDKFARHAPGLKSLEDALEMRRRILLAYERAERCTDENEKREWLTFVVVGGGPTGAELAGALAEISRQTLPGEFSTIDPAKAKIILIEGLDRILPSYPRDLSDKAAAQLRDLGVEVRLNTRLTDLSERAVSIGEERIATRTVLWAAGVQASPLGKSLGVPLDRAGRVKVEPDLSVPGAPDVFVIGDFAALECNGKPVPGVAPAAIQEGKHVAKNVLRRVRGQSTDPFRYWDKGSLATLGRAAAVADFGRLHLTGFLAWFAWSAVHLLFLIGFRNRAVVMFEWAWAYFTRQRSARLITDVSGAQRPPVE